MQNQAANNKRKEKDVMKLIMSGKFDVRLLNEDSTSEFEVMFWHFWLGVWVWNSVLNHAPEFSFVIMIHDLGLFGWAERVELRTVPQKWAEKVSRITPVQL